VTTSADLVLFAIQAALQLSGGMRTAFVQGTRDRPLVLPLPRAPGIEYDSASSWFRLDAVGVEVAKSYPRIQHLVALTSPRAEEKSELVELYVVLYAEHVPSASGFEGARGQLSGESLGALLEIRQWAKGQFGAPPTALQRVAGTIVNLAVDYFAQTPGAVSEKRPEGRALLAFLRAIDDADFATTAVEDVAGQLLIGVLDAVSGTPELVRGGENEQLLIQCVTRTLAVSARDQLASAPTTERWNAATWLQIAARSLVKGSADVVLAEPKRFLHLRDDAQANLVTHVGTALAELIIGERAVTIRPLLSAQGLDRIARATLEAVAANPSLLHVDNAGVTSLLTAIADDVSKLPGTLGADLFPNISQILLRQSAQHLELIWPPDVKDPDRNLLLQASRVVLSKLAVPPDPPKPWRPAFNQRQLLVLLDGVVSEVRDNPQWLLALAGGADSRLSLTLDAMLEAIGRVPRGRIDAETAAAVLSAGIAAVASRLELLDRLPAAGAGQSAIALTALLDAVFQVGAGAQASWRLARTSAVRGLVQVVLVELSKAGAGAREITLLREALSQLASARGPLDLPRFAEDLGRRLTA
jgi:hypothetical protein